MKPGTLVMLKKVSSPVAITLGIRVGHIGEVKPGSLVKAELYAGYVLVEFPGTTPQTGYWQCPAEDLIPISGPDIDIGIDEKQPVEDLV